MRNTFLFQKERPLHVRSRNASVSDACFDCIVLNVTRVPQMTVAIMMPTLVRKQMGGTEVYVINLVDQLARQEDKRFRFILVYANDSADRSNWVLLTNPTSLISEYVLKNVKTGTSHFRKLLLWITLTLRRKSIWQEIETATESLIDVALFPFTAIIPKPLSRMKTVTVIHDLQHRELPQSFSRGQRLYRRITYEHPARKADAVLTVSDFTKNTIAEYLEIDSTKIHRVYPGLRKRFISQEKKRPSSDSSAEQFLYYPARGLPHKNHRRLFLAFALVRQTYPNLTLKLSGSDAHLLGVLPENVEHMGNLSSEEIEKLYTNCRAVVFPSMYEGFGFPAIEALGMRAPLVVSAAGSLPEVVSDFAILVDPMSVESIAEGILAVLESPGRVEDAYNWASGFTWEITTQGILDVLATFQKG